MIRVKEIEKYYGDKRVLHIPDLIINPGEKVGLVGNNGAGKTTFISLMLDLIKADRGEFYLFELPVHATERWKHNVSAYLDENFLIDFLTPEEYFTFISKVRNISQAESEKRILEYEDLFRDEVLNQKKYIRNLSKGNKKKVGIVGALLPDVPLYVFDEPFANLDPTAQIQLKRILNNLGDEKTIFVSSHDLNHLMEICDRIIVLDKGEIKIDTPMSETTLDELEAFFTANI